jgi:hypothetical protein
MLLTDNIQYLTHRQIDKEKWNRCIDTATNGLIYAYSFYLDCMAQKWDALVITGKNNEYDVVMPLTWNRKFGINYLYQPFLTAQLGIFGKHVTEETNKAFIQSIPSSFRLIEISLNSNNLIGLLSRDIYKRTNYVLDLQHQYEHLQKNYRENIRRNIKKSTQIGCTAIKDFDVEKIIDLAVSQMKGHSNQLGDNVQRFRKLYALLHSRQMATTYGITLNDQLLASCVFFFSHHRAYYILVGNHPDGKTIGASHALIDAFIKNHAGKKLILDFEGSDIRNLAFFYSSFGATEEIYPAVKINRLPFYLKWMKK